MKKLLFLVFIFLNFQPFLFSQNVGVGTPNPQSKLHVTSSVNEVARFEASSSPFVSLFTNGVYKGYFWHGPGSIELGSATGSSLPITIAPDGVPRMYITTNGNVGIGGTNPGFPLNFESTPGDKISLYGNSGAHYGFGIQGSLLQIHTDISSSDIAFGYGSSASLIETMRIKGNGRIGIGTSAPTERLHVSGIVLADAFKFTSPRTNYFSIDPTAFLPGYGTYEIARLSEEGAYITSPGASPSIVAPVYLPHNATITSMTVLFWDISSTQNLQAILWRNGTDFHYNIGYVTSSGFSGFNSQTVSIISQTVDNLNRTYFVTVNPVGSSTNWPGGDWLKVKKVVIAYTVFESF